MSSHASYTRESTLVRTSELRRGDIALLADNDDRTLVVLLLSDLDREMRGTFVLFTNDSEGVNVIPYSQSTTLAYHATEWMRLWPR